MAVSKSKLFWSFMVGVCLAASAFIGVLYVQLKDISNLEELVAQELGDQIHRTVKIGSAQLDYRNGVRIRLQDVTLADPASGRVTFAVGKVWLSVRALPLLNREIKLRKVALERAVFQIRRDPQGNFHFSGFEPAPTAQTTPAEWNADNFSLWIKAGLMHEITLRQGELRFVDHYVSAGAAPTITHVENLSFTIAKSLLKPSLKYSLEGELQGRGELPTQINLFGKIHVPSQLTDLSQVAYEGKAEIQDLPLDDWRPYWKHWAVRLPSQHRVTLDAEFTGTLAGRFQSTGRLEHTLGSSQGPPVLSASSHPAHGTLDFELARAGDWLAIKQLAYRAGEWRLDLTGAFSELASDRPKVSWALSTANFPVANSEQYLPLYLLPAKFHKEIHEWLVQGDVKIRGLEFNGFLDELSGNVSAETLRRFSGDLVLHQAELGRRLSGLRDVDGTISLKKGLADMKIARARYQGISVQSLHAAINPFAQPARIEGALETQFDLQSLKSLWLQEGSSGVFLNLLGSAVNLQGMARTRIRFQGPMDHLDHLALQGKGVVEGVGWDHPTAPWPVTNLKGNFEFKRPEPGAATVPERQADRFWEVRFHNVDGEFGAHKIKDFDGNLVIEGETSRKQFKGKILLSHVRADELLPSFTAGRLQSFFQQVAATGGEIAVDYQSHSDPKAQPAVSTKGSLSIKELSLLHSGGFRPLQRVSAEVTFDDEKIILETRQAWYGDSAVQLYANFVNYKTPHPKLILKAVAPDFMQEDFTGVPFLDRFKYQGPARMEFTLNYTEEYLRFKNHLDLTRASYEYGDFLVKPENVANSIEAFAEIKPEGFEFKDLIFDLGDIRVSGSGKLDGWQDPGFAVQLASKNFKTREVAQYITPLKGSKGGTADFTLTGKGNFKHLEDAEFKGRITLRDVEYQHKDLLQPFTLNTRLRFVNNRFNIQSASLVSDRSRLQFKGTYVRGPDPSLNLALKGTSLYPSDFVVQSGETAGGVVAWLANSEWFMKGSGEVTVALDHFYHQPWRWKNVAGRIIFQKGKLKTKNLNIGASGKTPVHVEARLSLEDPQKPRFKASVVAREIPAEGFVNIFGDIFYKGLSGKLKKFQAHVQGQGKNWQEIVPTLKGRVSLNFKNGTIHTGRLLNGVEKLFGLPSDPAVEMDRLDEPETNYEEIIGDFLVKGGRANTENFLYGDAQRKVSLVGQFDLQHNTMDTVIGVAPMRGLDKFLKQIPLVGGILTGGDEKSLVKNYYKVTGSFDDPKTTPVPLMSLGKKVVGIFQGIVQTPEKIFSPSEKVTK